MGSPRRSSRRCAGRSLRSPRAARRRSTARLDRSPAAGCRSEHRIQRRPPAPGRRERCRRSIRIWAASFGIDHCRAARHGHGELVEQRPHRQELRAARRAHHDSLRACDQVVVTDGTLGGVELPTPASTIECRRPLGSVRVIRSPACSGPSRTPENWACSAIADTEESELPARAIGAARDLHPAP